MKSFHPWLLTAAIGVAAATGSPAASEEPPKEGAALLDLSATDLQLLDTTGSSRNFFINLNDSLLAANGLGIDVTPPDAALRAQLGLAENAGLIVTAAPAESRGSQAGLKVHDVIVKCGDQNVSEAEAFRALLDASDGKSIKLRLLRHGKPAEVEVTPQNPAVARVTVNRFWRALAPGTEERYRIGVTLSEADATLRTQLRLATGEGLVVTELVPDSTAAAAGIQTHDVLTVLDGKRLTTVEAINNQIQEIKEKKVELLLLRGGKELALQIAPRKVPETTFDDRVVTVWNTDNCRKCHGDAVDATHSLLGLKLHAAHSAWTNGNTNRLYLYEKLYHQHAKPDTQSEAIPAPQQQIAALKTQLAEMQKSLAALETALQPAEAKPAEKSSNDR